MPPSPSAIPGPSHVSIATAIAQQIGFLRDPIGFMRDVHAVHGRLVRFERASTRFVFAFGPEYNGILHKDPERFHSRGLARWGPDDSAQRRLVNSLFALNSAQHRRLRHLVLPPFQKSALPAYRSDLVNVLQRLLGR